MAPFGGAAATAAFRRREEDQAGAQRSRPFALQAAAEDEEEVEEGEVAPLSSLSHTNVVSHTRGGLSLTHKSSHTTAVQVLLLPPGSALSAMAGSPSPEMTSSTTPR